MRNRLFALSILALAIAMVSLAVACSSAAPAPTAAPAKPAAAPTTAPAAPAAAPTAAPAAPTAAPKPAWAPEKDVEFVVHAAAGGGSDIQARIMEKVIKDEKLYPKNVAVVNKVGGSGAVAFAYVSSKKGDPYYWLTATTSFFTTPARGQVPLDPTKDFTMLARLSDDNFTVVVKNDSPFKSMKEVVDAAKAKPKGIKWGGTNVGSDDHIFMYLLQRAAGIEFNFISTQSGGEVVTNLLGGHIDIASANLAEVLPQVEAKKVRLLAVGSDKKLTKYPNIPTLKDQGINISYTQTRMIAAPPGLPAGAREYMSGLLKKMTAAKGWKEYIDKNDQEENWMEGAQLDSYVKEFNGNITSMVKELGLVEKK
ncbi:MAG: tripartite tricarboxylate transporter substrate binding protein [Chloroflexi bacterium]|nr:tripartite tricarboxylate transporter substrate binding protein [Chloroflexota bacterium]